MPKHTTTDGSSNDYYRVEFAARAYTNPHVDSLNVCANESAAVVRLATDVDDVAAVLSTVFAPAERDGVTVAWEQETVEMRGADSAVVRVPLTTKK